MFEIQLFKIQQNKTSSICGERSPRHFCFPGLTEKLNLSMKPEKGKERAVQMLEFSSIQTSIFNM